MKKEDIQLFNTAIHKVKNIMQDLKDEREKHNDIIDKLMIEAREVLEEVYELFDRLSDNEYCNCQNKISSGYRMTGEYKGYDICGNCHKPIEK